MDADALGGRYLVVRRIAEGGMGVVYDGYDLDLERRVAIKQLRTLHSGSSNALARLRREAAAMARVNHANVVSVYDVIRHEADVLVVMELVQGDTLRRWLERDERVADAILPVFIAAGRGLAQVHACGLVHRDFKPANVLMMEDGRPRVTDFGLASLVGADSGAATFDEPSADGSGSITQTGAVMGTPRYMAPEQHLGRALDHRADQYAFCLALWEALRGRSPFAGAEAASLSAVKEAGVPRAQRLPVSRRIERALRRGLAADPEARWPSMNALLLALERPQARPVGVPLAVLGGAGVLATLTVLWRGGEPGCTEPELALETTWGDDARSQLQGKLGGAGPRVTQETSAAVLGAIDEYARAWQGSYASACARREDIARRDGELACLGARRAALHGMLDVLAAADAGTLVRARQLVSDLSRVEDCERADAPQPSPELERRVARLEMLHRAGTFEAVVVDAPPLLEDAACARRPAVCARIHKTLGRARSALGQPDAARSELQRAYSLATEAHRDDIAAACALELSNMLSERGLRPKQARVWLEQAEALAHRAAPTAPLRGLVLAARARMLELDGDREGARKLHQHAADACLDAAGGNDAKCWYPLHNVAAAVDAVGQHKVGEGLMERALVGAREDLGPDHPSVAAVMGNLAMIKRNVGEAAQARELHGRIVGVFERAHGPTHHHTLRSTAGYAVMLLSADRLDEADRLSSRAHAVADTDAHTRAYVLKCRALVELALGRFGSARGNALAAIESEAGRWGRGSAELFDEFVLLAEIERRSGEHDTALEHIGRAAATSPASAGSRAGIEQERAEIYLAMGDAERGAQALRAAERLAAQAPASAASNAWSVVARGRLWADVFRVRGQLEAARDLGWATLALARSGAAMPSREIVEAATLLARIELALGDHVAAREALAHVQDRAVASRINAGQLAEYASYRAKAAASTP